MYVDPDDLKRVVACEVCSAELHNRMVSLGYDSKKYFSDMLIEGFVKELKKNNLIEIKVDVGPNGDIVYTSELYVYLKKSGN